MARSAKDMGAVEERVEEEDSLACQCVWVGAMRPGRRTKRRQTQGESANQKESTVRGVGILNPESPAITVIFPSHKWCSIRMLLTIYVQLHHSVPMFSVPFM